MKKVVPYPDRIRRVSKGFGWVDHRLLRESWLRDMSATEVVVYLFLVLASDREGVSFYRKEKIADTTGLDFCDLGQAIADLESKGLIAFRPFCKHNPNGFYQVLEVPPIAPRSMPINVAPQKIKMESVKQIMQRMLGGER